MPSIASLRSRWGSVVLGVGLTLAGRSALAGPPTEAPPTESPVEGPAESPGESAAQADEPTTTKPASERTPRISGTYFGMTVWPGLAWASSPNQEVDQSAPIPGGGGALRLGQAVFPWMTIGLDASGGFYFDRHRFFTKGGLLVELGFYPVPRYPFSIRGGFGFGAGLLLDDRAEVKGGVGGPRFMGAVRYEFFPGAERKRPRKPGGWVVGPELGWRGFTPAAGLGGKVKSMSNLVMLGIWFGYYWGR
jgi:hypothetical protein